MTRQPLSLALALALAVVAACACMVSVVGLLRPAPVQPAVVPVSAAVAPAEPTAAEVLSGWDAARSGAWARGDPGALGALYAPGSAAGRRDQRMLRAWVSRGLVVTGMTTQLLAVEEVGRSDDGWTLRVTDRLVGAVAVGAGTRRPLPGDAATTRTVELRLLDGRWRVASVRGERGGGASGAGH